tara:strand:- start:954 stop:2072 length:1119 start_codon:yes stop_codon:yes gene_type:complete
MSDRLRTKIPSKYISKIKKDATSLPASKLSKGQYKGDYKWGFIPKDITSNDTGYKLPIVFVKTLRKWTNATALEVKNPTRYNNQKFDTITKSCMGVEEATGRILFIFIASKDDPAIAYATKHAAEVVEGMDKYLHLKSKEFYSGKLANDFATKQYGDFKGKIKARKTENVTKHQARYIGKNWLDGLQRWFGAYKINGVKQPHTNHITYYKMKQEGQADYEWRYKLARLFAILYSLEKRYSPRTAEYRLALARRVGMVSPFPNLPIEYNPATSVGGSVDFSSSFHSDSSIKGTLEAIIWSKATGKTRFVNGASGHYFNIDAGGLIFQVGTDYHGTAPTGKHGGMGFVNLTKSNLVSNTPFLKNAYIKLKSKIN